MKRKFPLHDAAAVGDLKKIKELAKGALFKKPIHIDQLDNVGCTPLMVAFLHQQYDAMECLVKEFGANINAIDKDTGQTFLHRAVIAENLDVVKKLVLNCKANVNQVDNQGRTPLHEATLKENTEIITFLIKKASAFINKADRAGNTALHYAAISFSSRTYKCLRSFGANANVQNKQKIAPQDIIRLKIVEENLEQTFRNAAANGNEVQLSSIKDCLSDFEIDISTIVDSTDKSGCTALHHAVVRGNIAVVNFLINTCHADVTIKDRRNRSPIDYINHKPSAEKQTSKYEAVKEALLNALPNSTHHAVTHNVNTPALNELLTQENVDKKEVNSNKNDGIPINTTLNANSNINIEISSSNTSTAVTPLIEEKKFNNNNLLTNSKDVSKLCNAAIQGKLEIIKNKIHSTDNSLINQTDSMNRTALHWAACYGHLKVVTYLVEHGADANLCDRNKKTPIHYAVLRGHIEVSIYLAKTVKLHKDNLYRLTSLIIKSLDSNLNQDIKKMTLQPYEIEMQRQAFEDGCEHLTKREYVEAEKCFASSFYIYSNLENPESVLFLCRLGEAVAAQEGRVSDALKLFMHAQQHITQKDESHRRLLKFIQHFIETYEKQEFNKDQNKSLSEVLLCSEETHKKKDVPSISDVQFRANLLRCLGKYEEANSCYQYNDQTQNALFYNLSGHIYLQQENVIQAQQCADTGESALNTQLKGLIALYENDKEKSEKYFKQAETNVGKDNIELALLYFERGQVYQAWRMFTEAKACYEEKVLQYEPSHLFASISLSKIALYSQEHRVVSVYERNSNRDIGILEEKSVHTSRQIGKGRFGTVYKGIWGTEKVAIKEIDENNLVQDNARIEFTNEIEIFKKINERSILDFTKKEGSINIIKFHGVVNHFQIVMEYMEEGSLRALLDNKKKQIPWIIRNKIALEIAQGIKYLHDAKKIVHGDLKSANIILDNNLTAKLCDFGSAKIINNNKQDPKKSLGTPGWMAPELFKSGASITSASDMYSYGVILWEITSHNVPFQGVDPSLIPRHVMNGKQPGVIQKDTENKAPKLAHLIRCFWSNKEQRPTAVDTVLLLQKDLKSFQTEIATNNNNNNDNNNSANTDTDIFDDIENFNSFNLN